jgi:hypothetical protein
MDVHLDPDPGDPPDMDWNWTATPLVTEIENDLQKKVTENREFRSSLQRDLVKKDSRPKRGFRKTNDVWNFERKDTPTGKFVRIKSIVEGDLEKINPIVMEKWLNQNVSNYSDCRRTRDGELIILSNDDKQTERFLKMNRIQTEPTKFVELKIELIDSMNRSKGTIFGSDILRIPEDGPDGLKKCFSDQGIVEHAALPTRNKDGKLGPNGLYVLTFDQRQPLEEVKIGYMRYTVKPWIPSPLKCQHCLEFGHTKNRCSREDDLCRGCNETKHEGECHVTKCHHCQLPKDQHQTFSQQCPVMQKEKKICQMKTELNISFVKARELVEKENEMNFAAALRAGNLMNEKELQDIDRQSMEAEKTLEHLQLKVKKLQEQQRMILLFKEKAEQLEAENLELTQSMGIDESQFEQFEMQIENEQNSAGPAYRERQLRSRTSTLSHLKKPYSQPTTSTPTIQKRTADEVKIKMDKKPKNFDSNSPSMQVPKKLTAEVIARFDVETMRQLDQFKSKNPNVDPYFVRSQDGRISFGISVLKKN